MTIYYTSFIHVVVLPNRPPPVPGTLPSLHTDSQTPLEQCEWFWGDISKYVRFSQLFPVLVG